MLVSESFGNNKNWNLFQKSCALRHYFPLFIRSQEHVIIYSNEFAKDFLASRISASILTSKLITSSDIRKSIISGINSYITHPMHHLRVYF
jgi:hypothetical protein